MKFFLAKALPFLTLGLLVLGAPLAVDPLSAEPLGHVKHLVVFSAAVGMILTWAVAACLWREYTHPASVPVGICIAAILGVVAIAATLADNRYEAADEVNRILLMLGMFAAAAHLRWTALWLRRFLIIALIPALWIAFTVIMEYTGRLEFLGVRVVFYRMDHRVLGFFGHNNVIAQYLLVAACWTHALMQGARTWISRGWLLGALSLILAGQYFTFSRSGWLSTLAGFCLATWLLRRREGIPVRQMAGRLLVAALVGLSIVLVVKSVAPSPDSVGFTASQWKEAGVFHHVSSGRFGMWWASLKMAWDHLLTGVGPGNYWVLYGWYDPLRTEFVRYAHNDYLQILGEYGLLGAGVFAAVAVAGFRWMWPRLKAPSQDTDEGVCTAALACGLLGAAVDAFLSYDLYLPVSGGLLAAGTGILVSLLRPAAQASPLPAPRLWLLSAATLALAFGAVVEGGLIINHWKADRANCRSIHAINNGKVNLAVEEAVRATRLKPGEAGYENALAVLFHRIGEPLAALRHYQAARLLSPYEMHNYAGILGILKEGKNSKELLHWYSATLQAMPHRQDIRNEYAYLLSQQGSHQDAAAQYEEILAQRPDDPLVLLNLANTYLRLPDHGRALPLFKRLVAMGGGTLDAPAQGSMDIAIDIARGLAVCLDGTGKTEEAYGILRQWLEKHPRDVWCYMVEIDIALRHEDHARILAAVRAARQIDPEVPLSPQVEALLKS